MIATIAAITVTYLAAADSPSVSRSTPGPAPRVRRRFPQDAQRVEDDRYIDDFLQKRTLNRRQIADRRNEHPRDRTTQTDKYAFKRDASRIPGNFDRGHDRLHQLIDQKNDVGGLCGSRRAVGAHRHADVGCRQRGRVVDPVADHHDGPPFSLQTDQDLLIGRQLRPNGIE